MNFSARPELDHVVFENAGEHLSSVVPVATPQETIGVIRSTLEGHLYNSVSAIAICEQGRLVGLIRIEELFAASADTRASDLMDRHPPVVMPGVDQEVAAWQAVQRGESTLAVTDADGGFLGFIPPVRILTVLLWEHEEDMARLGGFSRGSLEARQALEESLVRRLWHRLPWLIVGLLGALGSAAIVASREEQLADNVALAFFLPGIVYMADAVGTQTEALVIRGLSVGVSIGRVVRRELLTGVLVGFTLAIAFYPLAVLGWGERDVALAAAAGLVAACATASLVALALPALFRRWGMDPAFGSGPLATVIQDLLSILIYFGVALVIVD